MMKFPEYKLDESRYKVEKITTTVYELEPPHSRLIVKNQNLHIILDAKVKTAAIKDVLELLRTGALQLGLNHNIDFNIIHPKTDIV